MVLDKTLSDLLSTIKMKVNEPLTALTESKATFSLYLHYYLREGIPKNFDFDYLNV